MPQCGLVGQRGPVRVGALRDDLERPHDAAAVAGIDAGGGDRIEVLQTRVQRAGAVSGEVGFQRGTQSVVVGREAEVVDDARHVQSRAADEDRVAAARVDLTDRGAGGILIPGDGRLVGHLEHVEQVVRDAAALGDGKLRRPDVHAAVQLHRVGVHDLGGPAALCEGGGQTQRQVGLAGAGGADDGPQPG